MSTMTMAAYTSGSFQLVSEPQDEYISDPHLPKDLDEQSIKNLERLNQDLNTNFDGICNTLTTLVQDVQLIKNQRFHPFLQQPTPPPHSSIYQNPYPMQVMYPQPVLQPHPPRMPAKPPRNHQNSLNYPQEPPLPYEYRPPYQNHYYTDLRNTPMTIRKLDFPAFDNEESVTDWIIQVEQYFRFHQTDERFWVDTCSFYLKKEPMRWYIWYTKNVQNHRSWQVFKEEIVIRFNPEEMERRRDELSCRYNEKMHMGHQCKNQVYIHGGAVDLENLIGNEEEGVGKSKDHETAADHQLEPLPSNPYTTVNPVHMPTIHRSEPTIPIPSAIEFDEICPGLIATAKEGGVNTIETYVFWNGDELSPGNYYFEDRFDLVKFVKIIKDVGLYMILRIGPFVAAEYNYGGVPVWLHYVPGTVFRTNNEPFKKHMQNFTTYIVNMMKAEKLLASQGGHIILAQVENEYGDIEKVYGDGGKPYKSPWPPPLLSPDLEDKVVFEGERSCNSPKNIDHFLYGL